MSLRAEHWVERKHHRDGQGQFAHTASHAAKAAAHAVHAGESILPSRKNKAGRHAAQTHTARTEHVPSGPDRKPGHVPAKVSHAAAHAPTHPAGHKPHAPGHGAAKAAGPEKVPWAERMAAQADPHTRAQAGRKAIEAGDQKALHDYLKRTTEYHDEKTGLRAVVDDVQTGDTESAWGGTVKGEPGKARVNYKIVNAKGEKVGHAHRTWALHDEGGPSVYHADFQLDKSVRGGGFAKRWNARMEDVYRGNGVKGIKLNASGEGGGYAWARQGYGFADDRARENLAKAAVAKIEGLQGHGFTAAQLQTARKLAASKTTTPADWADLGGKELLAGLSWYGVKPLATAHGPMSDTEFEARTARVGEVIGNARKTLATEHTHTTPSGAWKPERDRIHRQIADELYAKAAHVPNDRRAVVAGGLGGAGKTTVLTKHAGIDPSEYLTLNPDDVKEVMAAKGLIPDVPGHPDLSPMERAALVHEESSRITSLMADRALREGKNMMWDITMSSESSVTKRIAALKASGYKEVRGVFVDIPVEVSVERAMSRYRRGADQHLAGKGPGGRYVPPAIIRAQRTSSGETINRGVFDKIKGSFSDWSMYDNSVTGRDPQLIKKGR